MTADQQPGPEVEQVAVAEVRDDGPKGYYGPEVELMLMDDGTVRWRYRNGS